jgi:hypothetical protein
MHGGKRARSDSSSLAAVAATTFAARLDGVWLVLQAASATERDAWVRDLKVRVCVCVCVCERWWRRRVLGPPSPPLPVRSQRRVFVP